MYCEVCGTKLDDDHKFCTGCGSPALAPAGAVTTESATASVTSALAAAEPIAAAATEPLPSISPIDAPAPDMPAQFASAAPAEPLPIYEQQPAFQAPAAAPQLDYQAPVTPTVDTVPDLAETSAPTAAPTPEQPKKKKGKAGLIIAIIVILLLLAAVVALLFIDPFGWNLFGGSDKESTTIEKPVEDNGDNSKDSEAVENPIDDGEDVDDGAGEPVEITLSAKASSELDGKRFYEAANAIDGNYMTPWVEAKADDGIGEWIQIDFSEKATISGIYIKNGFWRDEAEMPKQNRLKKIKVEFSDGTSEEFTLDDPVESEYNDLIKTDGQKLVLSEEHETTYVKITILEVYSGTETWKCSALSDVSFEFSSNTIVSSNTDAKK
jgi:hypothetical protein